MADLSDPARNAGSGYIFLFNILCAPAPLIILMVFLGLEALNGDLSFDGKVEGVQLLNVHEMVLLHYYQSFVAMLVFLASLRPRSFLTYQITTTSLSGAFAHLKTGQFGVVEDARTKARFVACDVLKEPGHNMQILFQAGSAIS